MVMSRIPARHPDLVKPSQLSGSVLSYGPSLVVLVLTLTSPPVFFSSLKYYRLATSGAETVRCLDSFSDLTARSR